jgi:MFS family permease
MWKILRHRGLRFILIANMVSMIGSGMNMAAVTWFLLKYTGTEVALGWLVALQTIPAMLLMPFSGVIIDREDRRHLVMILDAVRGLIILSIAVLALLHRVQPWQLYLMAILVAAGFWMFWPTVTALIQELTPDSEFVHSNTFLLAGVQGGWLLAGAFVGFVYNHIGLGGVLLFDFATYVVSFCCYLAVRKGRVVVHHAVREELAEVERSAARYFHEMREGYRYIFKSRYLVLLSISWALFLAAMLTTGVVSAPLSDRVLHAGAVGYGWLNGGWAIGAVVSAIYTAWTIRRLGPRPSVALTMAMLAACWIAVPHSHVLAIAVMLYGIGGSSRGVGGVALNSELMEIVPKHLMGRVQNAINLAGTLLQVSIGLLVGVIAHSIGIAQAFALIGGMYFCAFVAALVPADQPVSQNAGATVA